MMNEYERMFRDGLRQAALRRPALGTIDPAEVMAPRSADHQPATEPVAPEVVPPKVPLAGRHPGVRWAIGLSAAAAATAVLLLVPGLLAPKPMPAVPVATPQPTSETVEPAPTIESKMAAPNRSRNFLSTRPARPARPRLSAPIEFRRTETPSSRSIRVQTTNTLV